MRKKKKIWTNLGRNLPKIPCTKNTSSTCGINTKFQRWRKKPTRAQRRAKKDSFIQINMCPTPCHSSCSAWTTHAHPSNGQSDFFGHIRYNHFQDELQGKDHVLNLQCTWTHIIFVIVNKTNDCLHATYLATQLINSESALGKWSSGRRKGSPSKRIWPGLLTLFIAKRTSLGRSGMMICSRNFTLSTICWAITSKDKVNTTNGLGELLRTDLRVVAAHNRFL